MKCSECPKDAVGFAIYEAKVEETLFRAPAGWRCADHAKASEGQHAIFERGRLIGYGRSAEAIDLQRFVKTYQELGRRNLELWKTIEDRKSFYTVTIRLGLSKFTEAQVRALEQAWNEGRTAAMPKSVNVEVLTAEEAAREIARSN